MNTLGVLLSASCLAAALIELRVRSDLSARRMGSVLASAAWATMSFVALDQSRQCQALIRAHYLSEHQAQIVVPDNHNALAIVQGGVRNGDSRQRD